MVRRSGHSGAGSTDFWPKPTSPLQKRNRPIVGAFAPEANTNRLARLRRTDIRPLMTCANGNAQSAESRCHPTRYQRLMIQILPTSRAAGIPHRHTLPALALDVVPIHALALK